MKTALILTAVFFFIMAGLSLFLVIALWSTASIIYLVISFVYIYFAKEILKKIKSFND